MLEKETATKHLRMKLLTIEQRISAQQKLLEELKAKTEESEVAERKAQRRVEVLNTINEGAAAGAGGGRRGLMRSQLGSASMSVLPAPSELGQIALPATLSYPPASGDDASTCADSAAVGTCRGMAGRPLTGAGVGGRALATGAESLPDINQHGQQQAASQVHNLSWYTDQVGDS
jgi:hypothetical protein